MVSRKTAVYKIWKPSFRPPSFPTRPYLCNPFTPRRMCRFSIFMFTVGNEAFYVALPVFPSPAAQVPPQAARQVQTPRAAPAPHSGPAHPTRAARAATRIPRTPQQQAAAAPPPLVSLAMSSSHRRRPKGRHTPIPLALFAPHPVCRSPSDRPQASAAPDMHPSPSPSRA